MIFLILGTAVMAGAGMGWYGHKGSVHILAWGLKANEQDLIFQQMSKGECGGEIGSADQPRIKDAPLGVVMANPHYPAVAKGPK